MSSAEPTASANIVGLRPLLIDSTVATKADAVLSTCFTPDGEWAIASTSNAATFLFHQTRMAAAQPPEGHTDEPADASPRLKTTKKQKASFLTESDKKEAEKEEEEAEAELAAAKDVHAPLFVARSFNPYPLRDDNTMTTCVRSNPTLLGTSSANHPIYRLAVASSGGVLQEWSAEPVHASYEPVSRVTEPGNEIMTCDYAGDGKMLLTAGSDAIIRLYDTTRGPTATDDDEGNAAGTTVASVATFEQGMGIHGEPDSGHSSRIFSVRWVSPVNFVSAGWETSVLLWDTRQKKPARTFAGSKVHSDGIDCLGNALLCVSEGKKHGGNVQFFDLGTGAEMRRPLTADCTAVTGRLFRNPTSGRLCAWVAGGGDGGENSAFALEVDTGKLVASIVGLPVPIFSLATSPAEPGRILLGGAKNCAFRVTVDLAKPV